MSVRTACSLFISNGNSVRAVYELTNVKRQLTNITKDTLVRKRFYAQRRSGPLVVGGRPATNFGHGKSFYGNVLSILVSFEKQY